MCISPQKCKKVALLKWPRIKSAAAALRGCGAWGQAYSDTGILWLKTDSVTSRTYKGDLRNPDWLSGNRISGDDHIAAEPPSSVSPHSFQLNIICSWMNVIWKSTNRFSWLTDSFIRPHRFLPTRQLKSASVSFHFLVWGWGTKSSRNKMMQ